MLCKFYLISSNPIKTYETGEGSYSMSMIDKMNWGVLNNYACMGVSLVWFVLFCNNLK